MTATSIGRLSDMLAGEESIAGPKGFKKGSEVFLPKSIAENYPRSQWWTVRRRPTKSCRAIISKQLRAQYDDSKKLSGTAALWTRSRRSSAATRLPPGVMKMVKVFVAVKRKIQPGDKMAGRHGNKGVVSRILPMRRHAVPRRRNPCRTSCSTRWACLRRMNVGQILETHLGWACAGMGKQIGAMLDAYNEPVVISSRNARHHRPT